MSSKPSQNGPKLTAQQTAALDALMTSSTVIEAAEKANTSKTTLYRWLREDEPFKQALQDLQTELLDALRRRLITASQKALDALADVLEDPEASAMAKIRAAQVILEQMRHAQEADIAERLEAIEDQLNNEAQAKSSWIGT